MPDGSASGLAAQIRGLGHDAYLALTSLSRRHIINILLWGTVVLFFMFAWREIYDYRSTDIRFLGGPRAGESARQAQAIAESLNQAESFLGLGGSYSAEALSTDGFLDNYRRIAADKHGTAVGFSLDGLQDPGPSRVQVLLPLETSYVHFICTKDFLDACHSVELLSSIDGIREALAHGNAESRSAEIDDAARAIRCPTKTYPISRVKNAIQDSEELARGLSTDLIDTLDKNNKRYAKIVKKKIQAVRNARFYLGPTYSGTRVLASAIFTHLKIDDDIRRAVGVMNFTEMRIALRDGKIAGGFIVARPDSATVQAIARDGKCAMVPIDNSAGIKASGAFLREKTLKKYHYHKGDRYFCPDEITTLETRRVLVASSSMPTTTAYQVGLATTKVLGIDRGSIRLTNEPEKQPAGLSYDLHPGAELLASKSSPSLSLSLFFRHPLVQLVGSALVLGLIADLIAPLRRLFIGIANQDSKQNTTGGRSIRRR